MRPTSSCSSVSADGKTFSPLLYQQKSNWKLRAYEIAGMQDWRLAGR